MASDTVPALPDEDEDERQLTLEQVRQMISGASVRVSKWGSRAKIAARLNEVAAESLEADPEFYHGYRDLIDTTTPEWVDTMAVYRQARSWWYANSMEYVVAGIRLFHLARKDEIISECRGWNALLKQRAGRLDRHRDSILERARKINGRAFDSGYYPACWADEFSVAFREQSIEPPSYLMHTNAEEYKRDLAAKLNDIQTSFRNFEQRRLAEAGTVLQRMLANVGGQVGSINGNIEAFQKIMNHVQAMNFAGTKVFKATMDEVQDLIDGVDVNELRASRGMRAATKERIEALLKRHQELQQKIADMKSEE